MQVLSEAPKEAHDAAARRRRRTRRALNREGWACKAAILLKCDKQQRWSVVGLFERTVGKLRRRRRTHLEPLLVVSADVHGKVLASPRQKLQPNHSVHNEVHRGVGRLGVLTRPPSSELRIVCCAAVRPPMYQPPSTTIRNYMYILIVDCNVECGVSLCGRLRKASAKNEKKHPACEGSNSKDLN